MHITHLKKVGGSVMLEIPPPLLDILKLSPGSKVGITVNNGRCHRTVHPSTLHSGRITCRVRLFKATICRRTRMA